MREGQNSRETLTGEGSHSPMSGSVPDGPLPLESPFYVKHPVLQERAYEEVRKPGALIRVRAPRRWGKTSLINRILAQADAYGYHTAQLNFREANLSIMTDLDELLRWFCATIAQQLQLKPSIDQVWDQDVGGKVNCTTYLQTYVLSRIEQPLAVILDDVHQIFEYLSVAQDFLTLIRFWHEEANNLEVWGKLRLVITHSTEVYIPLKLSQSPFNVGLPIQLPEFSLNHIQDLAMRYGIDGFTSMKGAENLAKMRALLGGHPYLLHLALYRLSRQDVAIEQLLMDVPTLISIYRSHLDNCLVMLKRRPKLEKALKKVVISNNPVRLESILAYRLESMGIVVLRGDQAILRCDLYRRYFRDRLGQG
ncbi:MAG: AAA-like domain-containing protein [Leptolyngbyaceae cyanobacterium MO_188.B28]|nr:AAA-like domain-containing protein [Leptolyngbyaceae cyanobacterium MO_188.B28]